MAKRFDIEGMTFAGMRPLVFSWALLLLLLIPVLGNSLVVQAQLGGMPPLPFILGGEIYLDGTVVNDEHVLNARIGSWESRPALITEGRYSRLIVGPPDSSYIGQEVELILDGSTVASNSFIFLALSEPRFENHDLFFGMSPPAEMILGSDSEDIDQIGGVPIFPDPVGGIFDPVVSATNVVTSDFPWFLLILGAIVLLSVVALVVVRRFRSNGFW
jgi:hypothetical protein